MIPEIPTTAEIEERLSTLPDLVADAFIKWQNHKEEREMTEAKFCIELKASDPDKTATDLKLAAKANDELYKMRLQEILLEGEYMRLYERHLSNKKRADMRSAI